MTPAVGYRITAVAGGIVGCLLAAAGRSRASAVAVLLGVGIGTVRIDLLDRRIPTVLVVYGAIASSIAAIVASRVDGRSVPACRAAAGVAVVGGVSLLVHFAQPAGLGFGDVRLAALVGGLVGYGATSVPAAAATAIVAAAVAALVASVKRSGSVPFAPYLLGVAVLTLVVGPVW